MALTIARVLTALRWDSLQSSISTLTSRILGLEQSSYGYTVDVLWSGSVGSITSITLNRNLRVGDQIFFQHNDASGVVTILSQVLSVAPGQYIRFVGPNGVYTVVSIGATPNIINMLGYTSGFGVANLNALRLIKK